MTQPLPITSLNLQGKRALIRVDFNVPIEGTTITDGARIVAALPTIRYVLDHGGSCVLMSHLGRPKGPTPSLSLAPCAARLSQLLQRPVPMAPDCVGKATTTMAHALKPGELLMLENLRFHPAEEQPDLDPTFAKQLAQLGDCYINDAFGTAHRAHSSTATIAKYFPGKAAIGFLMAKEVEFLGQALLNPKRPFYAIIGGAKVSTKLGILKALVHKIDALFVGGGLAYTCLKAMGREIGDSLCEETMLDQAREIMALYASHKIPLRLPLDVIAIADGATSTFAVERGIPAEYSAVDIGPRTIAAWEHELRGAHTVFWNGPVGVFEQEPFAIGTYAIARLLASMEGAITVIGGGDSALAVQRAGVADQITHISTGGGASMEFIERGTLPGIDALRAS